MQLHFCDCCGHAIAPMAIVTPAPDAAALAAWQAEIARECQHVPTCLGPWQHAVRTARDEWARASAH